MRNGRPRARVTPMLGAQHNALRNATRIASSRIHLRPPMPSNKFTGYATRRIPRHTRTPPVHPLSTLPANQHRTTPHRDRTRHLLYPRSSGLVKSAPAPRHLSSDPSISKCHHQSVPCPFLHYGARSSKPPLRPTLFPCTQAKHKTGPGYQHVLHSCCLRQTCVMRMIVRMCIPADRR